MIKLILIAGASASGKTTIANDIKKFLKDDVLIINQDSYYKEKKDFKTDLDKVNYDSPSSFDLDLLHSDIKKLLNKESINLPIYDHSKFERVGYKKIKAPRIIIIEGILALYDKKINKMSNLKIFIETPSDICLTRRIRRDLVERQRDIEEVLTRWHKFVRPSFNTFIKRTAESADIIIPFEDFNHNGLSIIKTFLKHEI